MRPSRWSICRSHSRSIGSPASRWSSAAPSIRGVSSRRCGTRCATRCPTASSPAVATIGQQVDESLLEERLVSVLATFFGGLALAARVHRTLRRLVVRSAARSREIGIRIAIGAQRNAVIWLVLRETLLLLTIGTTLGVSLLLLCGALRREPTLRRDARRSGRHRDGDCRAAGSGYGGGLRSSAAGEPGGPDRRALRLE